MSAEASQLLESLRPDQKGAVMDLVAEAEVDVSRWSVKQDGKLVANPRANPHYCYEWAFGGDKEPTVLCVWHSDLKIANADIVFEDNLRDLGIRLERLGQEPNSPSDVKSRAKSQAPRAFQFDLQLQRAFRKSKPVRIILLKGEEKPTQDLGLDTSKVQFRQLDAVPWYVHSYSDEGAFRLVRGKPVAVAEVDVIETDAPATKYDDQFSNADPVTRQESISAAFFRSPEVRQAVLNRAQGICECCGLPGFTTKNGAIYLETHHVVPLSENGPDMEWNVVAICPNDHRRAHFSESWEQLRDDLIEKLAIHHPGVEPALRAIVSSIAPSH